MGFEPGSALDDLIRHEEAALLARMTKTAALWERAQRVMPGGVCSSWASSRPLPVWVSHGEGAYVWDADGTRYADMHGGYGVNVVGHANPAVVRAVQARVALGTHFAQPTEDSIDVAEALAQRFGLPHRRAGAGSRRQHTHGRRQQAAVGGRWRGHDTARRECLDCPVDTTT